MLKVVCPSPLLETVFSHPVATAELRSFRGEARVSEQDEIHVCRAVPKRRDEFAAGRLCAAAALKALGIPSGPVGREPSGAPIWPSGVVGSISHTDDLAVAVVAPTEGVKAIGVDIEYVGKLEFGMWPLLFSEAEQLQLREARPDLREGLATAAFAAKEAFYKAQWPITGEWVDFLDVEIELGENWFLLSPRRERTWCARLGAPVSGSFAREANLVVAAVQLPR